MNNLSFLPSLIRIETPYAVGSGVICLVVMTAAWLKLRGKGVLTALALMTALADVESGDVLVYPSRIKGHYEHAVYVADVARRDSKVALMIVEGNTPARSKHVLRNLLSPAHPAWYVLDVNDDTLHIWPLLYHNNELRRW